MLKIFKKYILSAEELAKLITDAYFSGVAIQEKSKSYYEVTLTDGKEMIVSASGFEIEKSGLSMAPILCASFHGINNELVAYIENIKQVIKIETDEDEDDSEE